MVVLSGIGDTKPDRHRIEEWRFLKRLQLPAKVLGNVKYQLIFAGLQVRILQQRLIAAAVFICFCCRDLLADAAFNPV